MARHFEAIDLTRPFVDSTNKLCKKRPELQEQIDATLSKLLTHPDSPGLHREPIECHWSERLRSCRVNRAVRLLEDESNPTRARAMYVGMHDSAYRWVGQYRGGGAQEIVECRGLKPSCGNNALPTESTASFSEFETLPNFGRQASDGSPIQHLGPARADEDSFLCIPVEELCKLGMMPDDAERIRRASVDSQLSSYVSQEQLVDAIYDLYSRYSPHDSSASRQSSPTETSEECESGVGSEHEDIPPGSAPMPIPLSSADDVITITAPGQFRHMMEIGLDRYLTTLTEQQLMLARTKQRNLLVIQGSGGSGKTTIAVHRLRYLAEQITLQPQLQGECARRVVYLCFNRALADVVKQMLSTLYGGQPPEHIEVWNLHRWARIYLEQRGVLARQWNANGNVRYGRVRDDLEGFVVSRVKKLGLDDPRSQTVSSRLSPDYIAQEIREVIIGRDLHSIDDYLRMEREGRKSGLRASERALVWRMFEEWCQLLESKQETDISLLPTLALRELANDTMFTPYEAVIVDEAQDLTPVALRLATQMAGRHRARITVFADAAQSIYRTGFRWKQAELSPRGRQLHKLIRNHRNTAQIYDMATTFLERGDGPDEVGAYITAERPTSEGPLPLLLTCQDAQIELREVVCRVRRQLDDGTPAQNIGILSGTNAKTRELAQALRDAGVAAQLQDVSSQGRIRITHPSVKVLTMHSAKGLDFPHVYVVGLTREGIPGARTRSDVSETQQETLEMQRRLLYTSMIRAGQTLIMTTTAGNEHPLLADLPSEVCRRETFLL